MSEPTLVEAAAPAVVPTQPIQFAQPARAFEFPSVTEYVTKALIGGLLGAAVATFAVSFEVARKPSKQTFDSKLKSFG